MKKHIIFLLYALFNPGGLIADLVGSVPIDLDNDETVDLSVEYDYSISQIPPGGASVYKLLLSATNGRLIYSLPDAAIYTNQLSSSVPPFLLSEPQNSLEWLLISNPWFANPDNVGGGFIGDFAEGKVKVYGFNVVRPTGKHFGWARVQGRSDGARDGVQVRNFDTNLPPIFSEVTINPVPYAAIQLGRPSPGGPKLTFARQAGGTLRLTYPEWGARYAVRRRNLPKGDVAQIYQGGREGLVATNGVYTVDVRLDQSSGFFELFLPAANWAP